MSISINVTPAASGGTFTVGSVSSQNLTLEVIGGIGPAGLGNLMLAEGDGIDIATVGNVATISTNLTIPANLADLADVAAAAPSTGQVLTYNGSAWTAAADGTNLTGYATESFVTSAVANLVDSSPAALDTLNELAAALGDDPNFSATITASLAGKAAANHTHNIADVTGLQSELDTKAATASLGTAAATNSTDYATAAQGSLADSAVQPGDLASVATSGLYSDLAGIPSEFTPASHTHTAGDITDFGTAAAANAPIQTVNNATGNIVIANGTGLTLTESGSTLTLAAALPPSNLADLADVSGTPSTNQALIYNGTEWQPGDIPAGTTINSLSGSVVLANGTGITLTESGQTLTLAAVAQGGDVDGGTFGAAGNVLTEAGSNLAAESGDTLTVEGGSSAAGDSIRLLRSSVAGATPGSLLAGELAINTEDGLLYWQRANGTIASAEIDLTLATVATTGSFSDLSGVPASFTPAAHTHTAADVTDFGTAAAANAPLQSLNSLTGTLTIAGSGGTTVTETGSTITVASTAPPTVLADLGDVSTATPSTGQVLKWTGSAWAPQADATTGTGSGGGGYGSLLLFG